MPVLRFRIERLEKLTGLTLGEVEELLFRLKCETEELDDYLEVEINPDRPDMFVGEGVARAVLGLAGKVRGWRPLEFRDSGIVIVNEAPPSRPHIVAAVVYNLDIDEVYLEELIQFQEKLHDTLGRRRRKAAIGFHDLEKLPSTQLLYTARPLANVAFTPLGYSEPMKADEVLEGTEQGRKYGGISLIDGEHPFLFSGDSVIAMPPVINSELTRVEPGTKSIFIDVTGTDKYTISKVLDIIVSALAERPGARVARVKIVGPGGGESTPRYEARQARIGTAYVSRVLGIDLDTGRVIDALERMLHNVVSEGDGVLVDTPPFRVDILSDIDLVEDVAIALGYDEIGYSRPVITSTGKLLDETIVSRHLRKLAIGLGFTEVMQLTLTSPALLEATGYKDYVEVLNPVQQEYSVLRPSLLPTLLAVLARNQHARKPVKLFEIGNVVVKAVPPLDEVRMALAIMDYETGFEDIQAPIYSMLRILGLRFEPRPISHPLFIEGRASELIADGERIAVLGEVSPSVLERLGITYPVAAAEVMVEVLGRWRSRT